MFASEVDLLQTELPKQRRERFRSQYGISRLRSEFLCDEKSRADYFEQAVAAGANPLYAAHWMASELIKLLKTKNISGKSRFLVPLTEKIILLYYILRLQQGPV